MTWALSVTDAFSSVDEGSLPLPAFAPLPLRGRLWGPPFLGCCPGDPWVLQPMVTLTSKPCCLHTGTSPFVFSTSRSGPSLGGWGRLRSLGWKEGTRGRPARGTGTPARTIQASFVLKPRNVRRSPQVPVNPSNNMTGTVLPFREVPSVFDLWIVSSVEPVSRDKVPVTGDRRSWTSRRVEEQRTLEVVTSRTFVDTPPVPPSPQVLPLKTPYPTLLSPWSLRSRRGRMR